MARQYWRLYELNPPNVFESVLPRRYGVLFSDELRHINEKTLTKPQIPGHKQYHKFLHLGNRIGILVNFQMEPARADTPEALPTDAAPRPARKCRQFSRETSI